MATSELGDDAYPQDGLEETVYQAVEYTTPGKASWTRPQKPDIGDLDVTFTFDDANPLTQKTKSVANTKPTIKTLLGYSKQDAILGYHYKNYLREGDRRVQIGVKTRVANDVSMSQSVETIDSQRVNAQISENHIEISEGKKDKRDVLTSGVPQKKIAKDTKTLEKIVKKMLADINSVDIIFKEENGQVEVFAKYKAKNKSKTVSITELLKSADLSQISLNEKDMSSYANQMLFNDHRYNLQEITVRNDEKNVTEKSTAFKCQLIMSDVIPSNDAIDRLKLTQNSAYIIHGSELYYINRSKGICEKVPDANISLDDKNIFINGQHLTTIEMLNFMSSGGVRPKLLGVIRDATAHKQIEIDANESAEKLFRKAVEDFKKEHPESRLTELHLAELMSLHLYSTEFYLQGNHLLRGNQELFSDKLVVNGLRLRNPLSRANISKTDDKAAKDQAVNCLKDLLISDIMIVNSMNRASETVQFVQRTDAMSEQLYQMRSGKHGLILISADIGKPLDLKELDRITKQSNGVPVLIKHGSDMVLYGVADGQWTLTKMSPQPFNGLIFPELGNQETLSYSHMTQSMITEIKSKNAHQPVFSEKGFVSTAFATSSYITEKKLSEQSPDKQQTLVFIENAKGLNIFPLSAAQAENEFLLKPGEINYEERRDINGVKILVGKQMTNDRKLALSSAKPEKSKQKNATIRRRSSLISKQVISISKRQLASEKAKKVKKTADSAPDDTVLEKIESTKKMGEKRKVKVERKSTKEHLLAQLEVINFDIKNGDPSQAVLRDLYHGNYELINNSSVLKESYDHLYSKSTKLMSRTILAQSAELFKQLDISELNKNPKHFTGPTFTTECPSLAGVVDYTNKLNSMVVYDIVQHTDLKDVVSSMEYWINVADRLANKSQPNDYLSAMAITSALNRTPVYNVRARASKQDVTILSRRSQHKLDKLNELISPDNNFKNLRGRHADATNSIPYIGIYQTDMTFAVGDDAKQKVLSSLEAMQTRVGKATITNADLGGSLFKTRLNDADRPDDDNVLCKMSDLVMPRNITAEQIKQNLSFTANDPVTVTPHAQTVTDQPLQAVVNESSSTDNAHMASKTSEPSNKDVDLYITHALDLADNIINSDLLSKHGPLSDNLMSGAEFAMKLQEKIQARTPLTQDDIQKFKELQNELTSATHLVKVSQRHILESHAPSPESGDHILHTNTQPNPNSRSFGSRDHSYSASSHDPLIVMRHTVSTLRDQCQHFLLNPIANNSVLTQAIDKLNTIEKEISSAKDRPSNERLREIITNDLRPIDAEIKRIHSQEATARLSSSMLVRADDKEEEKDKDGRSKTL